MIDIFLNIMAEIKVEIIRVKQFWVKKCYESRNVLGWKMIDMILTLIASIKVGRNWVKNFGFKNSLG